MPATYRLYAYQTSLQLGFYSSSKYVSNSEIVILFVSCSFLVENAKSNTRHGTGTTKNSSSVILVDSCGICPYMNSSTWVRNE